VKPGFISVAAILSQVTLFLYHQATTLLDFYPFNGARHFEKKERLAECGVNGLLMILAPIGFGFHIRALMLFGLVYYFLLFAIELIIWWIPYLTTPRGCWRSIYNWLLACATSNFGKGDTLVQWQEIHQRLYRGTISVVSDRGKGIVPNLEHTVLHVWTLITAIVTTVAWRGSP
jgi:hypothetical protein